MEWEEFHSRLIQLKSVSARSDNGQSLVDHLSNVGLNARPGRLPDIEETKVSFVSEFSTRIFEFRLKYFMILVC